MSVTHPQVTKNFVSPTAPSAPKRNTDSVLRAFYAPAATDMTRHAGPKAVWITARVFDVLRAQAGGAI